MIHFKFSNEFYGRLTETKVQKKVMPMRFDSVVTLKLHVTNIFCRHACKSGKQNLLEREIIQR